MKDYHFEPCIVFLEFQFCEFILSSLSFYVHILDGKAFGFSLCWEFHFNCLPICIIRKKNTGDGVGVGVGVIINRGCNFSQKIQKWRGIISIDIGA